MESKIEDILEKCTEKTKPDIHNYINLAWWSFLNNFKDIKKDISFDEIDDSELMQFIKICDNRLDRSKTFLNDIAVVFGFDLLALSIIVNVVIGGNKTTPPLHYFIVIMGTALLFVILIILLLLLGHYRSDIHAWTAFKEKALINDRPCHGDLSCHDLNCKL